MNYWMAVGTQENWEKVFREGTNIWGLKEQQSGLWCNLQEGDKHSLLGV